MKEGRAIAEGQEVNTGCVSCAIQCICMCQVSAVTFCIQHNIALLCLPPHTTHILQPLDIKLFAPLQTAYQKGVRAKSWFQGFYQVDKVEFLEILQDAHDKAFTTKNILSRWQAAGLLPFNPEIIMKAL